MAKCQEQALFRYTWAGRNESFCCLTHAQQIQGVAQAMGYYVQLIPLSGDEQSKVSCQNEVRANNASTQTAGTCRICGTPLADHVDGIPCP